MTEELTAYIDKCRCCYGVLEGEDTSLQINKVIEKRFQYLSEIEVKINLIEKVSSAMVNFSFQLRSSSLLSNKICMDCHTKLGSFSFFKKEIISKQENLYQLLEEGKISEQIEEIEDEQSYYGEEKTSKLEPEIAIKTEVELEVFKVSEVFDSIDYADDTSE